MSFIKDKKFSKERRLVFVYSDADRADNK